MAQILAKRTAPDSESDTTSEAFRIRANVANRFSKSGFDQ